jgi:hypothetical protein
LQGYKLYQKPFSYPSFTSWLSRNKAIRLEYQKQNKILMTGNLGDYA